MTRTLSLLLLCASALSAWPHITQRGVTEAAAVTTIAVNVVTIKETWSKTRAAAKTTGRVVKKMAKKVGGR